jgi:hypothetical protein
MVKPPLPTWRTSLKDVADETMSTLVSSPPLIDSLAPVTMSASYPAWISIASEACTPSSTLGVSTVSALVGEPS